MQVVRVTESGDCRLESAPKPDPDPDEARLRVRRVQLSVTECQMLRGDLAVPDALTERMRSGDGRVYGHEFCAVVDAVGADVDRFAPGDRVYAPGKVPCGACSYCERGSPFLCSDKATIGHGRYPGALAEYVALPVDPLRALSPSVSDAAGAALQPVADAVLTVHDAGVGLGDTVAVVGGGVMGSHCASVARAVGAGRVLVVDVSSAALGVADEFGFETVDASEGDPVREVRRRTDGMGPDVVFEAVGGRQSHGTDGDDPRAQAFRMVREGGTLVQVGILADELRTRPKAARSKGLTVVNPVSSKGLLGLGPHADTGTMAVTLAGRGAVDVERHVTHELSGLGSVSEAVEITRNKGAYDALGPAQILVDD